MFITQDERKISLIGGLILTILTLSAGFSVYLIMQKQTESLISASLEVTLENKIQLFEYQIEQGMSKTRTLTTNPILIKNLVLTQTPTTKDQGINDLKQIIKGQLQENFTGIVLSDNDTNTIIHGGIISDSPLLEVNLNTTHDIDTFLLWDDQFILRTRRNIVNQQQQIIGSLLLEQAIPAITHTFTSAELLGETGDFMLCAPIKGNDLEMNCFLRGVNGHEFKRVQRIIANKPLPMHFALAGQRGIKITNDYRQELVVAAHSPMAYGLGTVLKLDQNELHQQAKKQLEIIFLLLTVLVLGGLWILYRLNMPLIRKLIQSEQTAQLAQKNLQAVKDKVELTSAELAAYIDAIGALALISVADRNGRILKANAKFCEVSGYTEQELLGKDHRILNSKTHPKAFFITMWSDIANGKTWHDEICNRNKDGKLYWVDSTIVPLKDITGKTTRYLSVRVDITARKQQHMALKERLKESACLHAIRNDISLNLTCDNLYQRVLDHLILALQFPAVAAACIKLDNKCITAGQYDHQLTHSINAVINPNNKIVGNLQVFYTESKFDFLPDEQFLIDTIANDLGRWLERKQAEERILQMANHDALTGLPNRRLLQDRIKQVLAHGNRVQAQMAVLFIDLDHFKIINDSLGHDVGDLLLKEVATRLTACVRDEDTVARQGGDEFIIVLHSIADATNAGTVAQNILEKLIQPFVIRNKELHIGGSIGIATFPSNGSNSETLLKNSDIAMYHAKQSGRNNYKFFSQEMNQIAEERQSLGTDLRYAIERQELLLLYQPVISIPGAKLRNMEALLRWQHPNHGLISPQKFIELAEETGLIIPIGEWVIKAVCSQIKAWLEQGYEVPRIAVNLSAKQFQDKNLVNTISLILHETEVAARYITLEITESMLIDNIEKVVQTLSSLTAMGLEISIDDFGTGYSSLSYLKRFPINTLKIDRSFIQDINSNSSDSAIVSAIIAMAKSLDINVIAEGVENKKQLDILKNHGCRHFQGYYFSMPITALEMVNKLQQHKKSPNSPGSKDRHLHSVK